MASLILHNLPEATIRELEERAQHNSRSVEDEVIELLETVKQLETRRGVEPPTSALGEALRRFRQEAFDDELSTLEDLRDKSLGREDELWHD